MQKDIFFSKADFKVNQNLHDIMVQIYLTKPQLTFDTKSLSDDFIGNSFRLSRMVRKFCTFDWCGIIF